MASIYSNVGQLNTAMNTPQDARTQTGWWSKLTGGQVDKAASVAQADYDRNWQAEQAKISRDYQERLSNTAYQRSMSDMKAAGLNPALMYSSGGSGASTPSATTPSGRATAPTPSSTGQLAMILASVVGAGIAAGTKVATARQAATNAAALAEQKAAAAIPSWVRNKKQYQR